MRIWSSYLNIIEIKTPFVHSVMPVQMHVLESCILSHGIIYKLKLSWMCLPLMSFDINRNQYDTKMSTCRESQSWCSPHAEVYISFLQQFSYQMTKTWHDVNELWHSLDLYITEWNIIPKHAFEPGISSSICKVRKVGQTVMKFLHFLLDIILSAKFIWISRFRRNHTQIVLIFSDHLLYEILQ